MDSEPPAWLSGENAALALRQRHRLGDAPINIWDLIRKSGVDIFRGDFGADGGDGLYIRKAARSLIVVNTERRASKQRFTAAHELGHHELHRFTSNNVVIADDDIFSGHDPREQAANSFAAHLLAPEKGIEEALEGRRGSQIGETDVVTLMQTFGLSYQATCWRLKNSRLINLKRCEALLLEPGVETLVARAGFSEEETFPPGPRLPPRFVGQVDDLWRRWLIHDDRHAQMLRTTQDHAAQHLSLVGMQRNDSPDIDEGLAASILRDEA
jgi:Zn-dependent peptidase ImmA (M78 family)